MLITNYCPIIVIILIMISIIVLASIWFLSNEFQSIHLQLIDNVLIIDGHNDLPMNIRSVVGLRVEEYPFESNLTNNPKWSQPNCEECSTDLPRLKQGQVGAQFWSAYTDCGTQYKDAVERTLEQIDLINRFIRMYPEHLELARSAKDIRNAFKNGKIASLIGVEGGHSIDSRLSLLRIYYELGVRYLTLTHACNTPWADASPVDSDSTLPRHNNLTEWGQNIVLEMNRLGMLIDLSHVSHNVMESVLHVSKAPVIFSHSSAYGVHPHHRNVRDDILLKLKTNNGIVMVNFFPTFLCFNNQTATVDTVIDHIEYIVNLIGVDHVGIGSDYDGIKTRPLGLEDVSKYPNLIKRLVERHPQRWTLQNINKLAHQNILRVLWDAEKIRDSMVNVTSNGSEISKLDLIRENKINSNITKCREYL